MRSFKKDGGGCVGSRRRALAGVGLAGVCGCVWRQQQPCGERRLTRWEQASRPASPASNRASDPGSAPLDYAFTLQPEFVFITILSPSTLPLARLPVLALVLFDSSTLYPRALTPGTHPARAPSSPPSSLSPSPTPHRNDSSPRATPRQQPVHTRLNSLTLCLLAC